MTGSERGGDGVRESHGRRSLLQQQAAKAATVLAAASGGAGSVPPASRVPSQNAHASAPVPPSAGTGFGFGRARAVASGACGRTAGSSGSGGSGVSRIPQIRSEEAVVAREAREADERNVREAREWQSVRDRSAVRERLAARGGIHMQTVAARKAASRNFVPIATPGWSRVAPQRRVRHEQQQEIQQQRLKFQQLQAQTQKEIEERMGESLVKRERERLERERQEIEEGTVGGMRREREMRESGEIREKMGSGDRRDLSQNETRGGRERNGVWDGRKTENIRETRSLSQRLGSEDVERKKDWGRRMGKEERLSLGDAEIQSVRPRYRGGAPPEKRRQSAPLAESEIPIIDLMDSDDDVQFVDETPAPRPALGRYTGRNWLGKISNDTPTRREGAPGSENAASTQIKTPAEAASLPNGAASSSRALDCDASRVSDDCVRLVVPLRCRDRPPSTVKYSPALVSRPSPLADDQLARDRHAVADRPGVPLRSTVVSERNGTYFSSGYQKANPAPISRPQNQAVPSYFYYGGAAHKPAAVSKPLGTASKPLVSVPKSLATAPKPVAYAPQTAASAASVPKPVASAPEKPLHNFVPKPLVSVPNPVAPVPTPVASALKPLESFAPKPAGFVPKPLASVPGLVAAAPKPPESIILKHVASAPKPVSTVPRPVAAAPKPLESVIAKQVDAVPKPLATAPRPVAAAPKPLENFVPKSVDFVPKPVATVPRPMAAASRTLQSFVPEPATSVPKPAVTVPRPVASAPRSLESVIPEPVSVPKPVATAVVTVPRPVLKMVLSKRSRAHSENARPARREQGLCAYCAKYCFLSESGCCSLFCAQSVPKEQFEGEKMQLQNFSTEWQRSESADNLHFMLKQLRHCSQSHTFKGPVDLMRFSPFADFAIRRGLACASSCGSCGGSNGTLRACNMCVLAFHPRCQSLLEGYSEADESAFVCRACRSSRSDGVYPFKAIGAAAVSEEEKGGWSIRGTFAHLQRRASGGNAIDFQLHPSLFHSYCAEYGADWVRCSSCAFIRTVPAGERLHVPASFRCCEATWLPVLDRSCGREGDVKEQKKVARISRHLGLRSRRNAHLLYRGFGEENRTQFGWPAFDDAACLSAEMDRH